MEVLDCPVGIEIEYSCGVLKGALSFNASIDKLKTKRMVLNENSTVDKEVIFNQNRKCVGFAVTFHLILKRDELAKTLALPLDKKLTQKLFLDTKFCDVKVVSSEGKIFECHKNVLCLQSEVFERMLANNNMAESTSGEIKATETRAVALEALLYKDKSKNLLKDTETLNILSFWSLKFQK